MLVAIAIPVFTSQLEKSREATDAANIRAAYAEVTVKAIDDNSTSFNRVVPLKQTQPKWQNTELEDNLKSLFSEDSAAATELAKVNQGQAATISWNAPAVDGSKEGYVKIAVAAAP